MSGAGWRWARWLHVSSLGASTLLLTQVAAATPLYGPPTRADPPLAPGSAAEPTEDAESASPTAPQKYPPATRPTGAPLSADDKRANPGYEAEEPASGALWVPRVILFPLYLVSEFVVRRPLGALSTYAEAHDWPQKFLYATSFGTYGTDHQMGILPTATLEWGVRANAGLYFYADNAFAQGNHVRLSATAGGPNWLQLLLADRVDLGPDRHVALKASVTRRADQQFWGFGPQSPSSGFRYRVTQADGALAYHNRFWRTSEFNSAVGLRSALFDNHVSSGPSVAHGIATGSLVASPPGFEGYTIAYQRLAVALDTRRLREQNPRIASVDFVSPPGTGARLELLGEHDATVSGLRDGYPPVHQWVRYGGEVGVYGDITGMQRTLGLSVSTELADPIEHSEIPFVELPSLGGLEPMRAFKTYRFIDRSWLVTQASYQWPIWPELDGRLEAALGNVFGPRYQGFDPDLLRGSFALGVETTGSRDLAFQVLFGIGTRTIRDGFGVEKLRFVAGTSSEF